MVGATIWSSCVVLLKRRPPSAITGSDLNETAAELQELSRGIHPAILSQAGLLPALRALARRSTVPVELDLAMGDRLPEAIEVALYYVASESLTNTVKHAAASFVSIAVAEENGVVHLSIHDDGVGGADPKRGSGLIGLRDRVEALGGTIEVESAARDGTSVVVALPLAEQPPQRSRS